MKLSKRQKDIIQIVQKNEPISGDKIAEQLDLSKSTLRSDLAALTMIGILDARPKVGYIFSGLDFDPFVQDELASLTVADIMAPPVIVSPTTKLKDAITTLFMYDAGTLVVSDDQTKEMVGILSRKDLLRSLSLNNSQETAVAVIMTRMPNIYTVTPETRAIAAAKKLAEREVDTLPVVKEYGSNEVIGKISKTTLVHLLIDVGERGRRD